MLRGVLIAADVVHRRKIGVKPGRCSCEIGVESFECIVQS